MWDWPFQLFKWVLWTWWHGPRWDEILLESTPKPSNCRACNFDIPHVPCPPTGSISPRIGITVQDTRCQATVIGRASPVSMTACMAWQSHGQQMGGRGTNQWLVILGISPKPGKVIPIIIWQNSHAAHDHLQWTIITKISKTSTTHELLAGSDVPPWWLKQLTHSHTVKQNGPAEPFSKI